MPAIQIDFDHSKCTTPFDCKKCLEICAPGVLKVSILKMERGKETDKKQPGTYKMEPWFIDRCTGCMDCANVCPVQAITVTAPQEVAI
jgi:NADH-quinone oxidoreductase subunit I